MEVLNFQTKNLRGDGVFCKYTQSKKICATFVLANTFNAFPLQKCESFFALKVTFNKA